MSVSLIVILLHFRHGKKTANICIHDINNKAVRIYPLIQINIFIWLIWFKAHAQLAEPIQSGRTLQERVFLSPKEMNTSLRSKCYSWFPLQVHWQCPICTKHPHGMLAPQQVYHCQTDWITNRLMTDWWWWIVVGANQGP